MTQAEVDYLKDSLQAATALLVDANADRQATAMRLASRWQTNALLGNSEHISVIGGYWADLEVPDQHVDRAPSTTIHEKLELIRDLSSQNPAGGSSPAP